MAAKNFKVVFTLDDDDTAYFRGLFRAARKAAKSEDEGNIIKGARKLVGEMRKKKKTPGFVLDAMKVLDDLTAMIEDVDYNPPKTVRDRVLGALAYFSNPGDLIPDDIPVFGFLDDALMIKLVEAEFVHELWAFRKFRKFRDGAEQRPWTSTAKERHSTRLAKQRKKLRLAVTHKVQRDSIKARLTR
ncbi:MAG: YkvA family protein [Myxococcota bacterium]|nr:YkvA family protein [Myxococcota bacterium]